MDPVIYFVGRFHPLIVHLPVALLPLAGIFWMLAKFNKFKKLEGTIEPILIVGSIAAMGSVLSGFALASGGEYDELLLNKHRALGIISTCIGLLALFLHSKNSNPNVLWTLFAMLVVLVSLTGHWGGMLTHGENWFAMEPNSDNKAVLEKLKTISLDSSSNAQLYGDLVAPLLDARCVSCHNAQKQKGELRLDNPESIRKGGKHGAIVDIAKPEKSELLLRITKSIEEKGHMPPRQEAQLNNLEIELLKWWIIAGAPYDKTVTQTPPPALLSKLWNAKPVEGLRDWLPVESIEPLDQALIDSVEKYGIKLTPISQESNYLSATTTGERSIHHKAWPHFAKLVNHLVDLDISYLNLNDESIIAITKLPNLRRLKMNHTSLSDKDLNKLTACTELRSLHIVNTKLTSNAASSFKTFKYLKEIFIYGTNLSKSSIPLNNVKVDTGHYTLPKLATDTIVYQVK